MTTMQSTGLPFIGWAVTKSFDGSSEVGYGAQWDGETNAYGDAFPPVVRQRGAIQRSQVERPVRFRLGADDEWCASGVVSAAWLEDDRDPVYASLVAWAEYEYGCADVYFNREDAEREGIKVCGSDLPGFGTIYG